jgi:Uma2 family endonuclease
MATASELLLYRLTVGQFHRMIDAGVFGSDRVELLEGLLVRIAVLSPPNATALGLAHTCLRDRLPEGWIVRTRSPVTTDDSEPEPSLVVAVDLGHRYAEAHPSPKEVGLIVEVSDTTLWKDREVKARIYARGGIPTYWIVNLPERQIEVYTSPRAGKNPTYRQRQDYRAGQAVPLTIGGQECEPVPVGEVLR